MATRCGLSLKGDFSASENVTIDFEIDGSIDVTGYDLTLAEGTSIKATVNAATVVVHGRLDGHISADRVALAPTAVVTASIVSPRLLLQDGAEFTGPVNTDRAQAALSVARHRQKAASEGSR